MTENNTIIYMKDFMPLFPKKAEISFIKEPKKYHKLDKFLIKLGLKKYKSSWALKGVIVNYKEFEILKLIVTILLSKFPNNNIKTVRFFQWDGGNLGDDSYYTGRSNSYGGGSMQIYLEFTSISDEASFILTSDTIKYDINKAILSDPSLVKTP